MLISESHQFIFLAVPKTGTSSIEVALADYKSPLTNCFNKHATSLKLQRDLPSAIWNDYFKFAFVRNPYDRMLSWYYYRKRQELSDINHPRHNLYTGDISFDRFIHEFANNELMLKQTDFIAPHGGGLLVDFVGRFERLQEDFDHLCIEQFDLPKVQLPKKRKSKKPASSETIWTDSGRRIINEYFLTDFELFDYPML